VSVGTISKTILTSSKGQDIIFIPLALLLAVLSVDFLKHQNYKSFITMIGITSSLFYGYGLYSMQGQYTALYLVYLAIFGLSIYSIVLGFLSFKSEFEVKTSLPKSLRIGVSIFLYSIVLMLGMVWIIRITPDIAKHIPQGTYGVFVLDLGIVFPAIAIIATKLIRNKPYGNIFSGVALVKTITVCLSWGFAEWYSRFCGTIEGGYDMLLIPSILTVIGLVFFLLYISKLKYNESY
jgi:hypothetical protein